MNPGPFPLQGMLDEVAAPGRQRKASAVVRLCLQQRQRRIEIAAPVWLESLLVASDGRRPRSVWRPFAHEFVDRDLPRLALHRDAVQQPELELLPGARLDTPARDDQSQLSHFPLAEARSS